jgi:hypothetical protein
MKLETQVMTDESPMYTGAMPHWDQPRRSLAESGISRDAATWQQLTRQKTVEIPRGSRVHAEKSGQESGDPG